MPKKTKPPAGGRSTLPVEPRTRVFNPIRVLGQTHPKVKGGRPNLFPGRTGGR